MASWERAKKVEELEQLYDEFISSREHKRRCRAILETFENSVKAVPWSQRLSFILSWQILRREPLLYFFYWHEAPEVIRTSNQNLTSRISTSRSYHSGPIFSVVCLEIGESRTQSSNEDCLRGYSCEHTWTRAEADDNMAEYLTLVIVSFAGASEYFNSQTEMEFLLRCSNEDYMQSCERVSRSLYRQVPYTKGSSAFQWTKSMDWAQLTRSWVMRITFI